MGVDVAGRVEAIGKSVTEFTAGGDVFGTCRRAFAELAVAPASAVVVRPRDVTDEQAASVPVAAMTALQSNWCDRSVLMRSSTTVGKMWPTARTATT